MEILKPNVTFSPVGFCIYCGTKQGRFTDEHIIPFGLGGTLILPKSSCRACAAKTAATEQTIQRMILGPFRIRFGLPTRRKKERPSELELLVSRDGQISKKLVPISEFPFVYHTIKLPSPRVLLGLPPAERIDAETVVVMSNEAIAKYASKPGQYFSPGVLEPIVFCRFLAKIAHSFAVGRLGHDHFRPLLLGAVLGAPEFLIADLFQFIGCGREIKATPFSDPTLKALHICSTRSEEVGTTKYVVVSIQLFSFLATPTYDVVIGECQGPQS